MLGKLGSDYLRHDGPEHVLCFAPTRSGKGVGLVVPTLLTWPGSSIVHDIKGENWELTSGFRSRHGRVLLFDPTNAESAAYNPLLEVRRGEWEVRDVQNIADVLVDPEGALERRNHWEKTSHALLVGAILHVLYAGQDKTLAGVAAFLSDPKQPIETTLRAMMTTPHLGEAGVHPVIASAARELLNKSENERSGVLSTAMSFLGLYRDPVVAQVTRRCDWRIRDLVEDERPTTLYLVVPPSDISRTKPLVRLVLNQIGRRLTEELHAKGRRHRLLLMLDEFPALGRLDFFESALAFMAGYGLKSFLIAQSLNQIEKAYGPNNAILDNCHVRVSFATNDERTAKRVSDALGTATEIRDARNYAGHRLSPWLGHLMVSRQETARPLLTPGEVMQLPATDELVLVSGCPPIRARKARYYEDRRLTERLFPATEAGKAERLPAQRRDDWSGTPAPASRGGSEGAAGFHAAHPVDDPANGGIRREPELAEHEDIAPEPPKPSPEFAFGEDEPDEDAVRARALRADCPRSRPPGRIGSRRRHRPLSRRMRTKHTFRLPPDLALKLADYALRKRVPQALIVETALASFLSPDGSERLEGALGRRLDRLIRQVERLERHVTISNEALALFVRFWLTATPPLPDTAQTGRASQGPRTLRGLCRGARPAPGQRPDPGRRDLPGHRACR